MKTEILIQTKADRDAIILALVNSGYTVRAVDRKTEGKRGTERWLEYWKEGEADVPVS